MPPSSQKNPHRSQNWERRARVIVDLAVIERRPRYPPCPDGYEAREAQVEQQRDSERKSD